MATRADITILDEPVSGVDAISRNKIYEIILRDYIEHPRTILISSHMLGEMEKILSHMIMIGNNDVLFAGDIEELKDRQSSEHSLREVNDPGIQVIDTYYYQVEGVRMKERLLIFAADYQHLDQTGKLFYLHKDKYKANCCI